MCLFFHPFFSFYPYSMDTLSIHQLSAPSGEFLEPPQSSKPITALGFELHPGFIAMVREQFFSSFYNENPYHQLREFKQLLTQNDHTPKPESIVCQARTALDLNQDVPVNLICKLTRKQQTIKYKSVSAGFPKHSYAAYRQGSTEIENDSRSDIKSVY